MKFLQARLKSVKSGPKRKDHGETGVAGGNEPANLVVQTRICEWQAE